MSNEQSSGVRSLRRQEGGILKPDMQTCQFDREPHFITRSYAALTPPPSVQVLLGDWCQHAGCRASAEVRLADAIIAATAQAVVSNALLPQGVFGLRCAAAGRFTRTPRMEALAAGSQSTRFVSAGLLLQLLKCRRGSGAFQLQECNACTAFKLVLT